MSYSEIDDGRTVKLRKPRACEWCGVVIGKDERAVRRVYTMYGEMIDARMHPECYAAMGEACRAGEDEFLPGEQKRGSQEERND